MSAEPVTILVRWVPIPVFHLHGPWETTHIVERVERDDGLFDVTHRWRTACGRLINAWGWTEDPAESRWSHRFTEQWDNHTGLQLRRDHAEKIGRPCLRCAATGG